ncbi:MAG: elongation factor 4 [Parcubacteria group bacterium]|nr:elongation factor 4 [Parcubacteria group bacterium]
MDIKNIRNFSIIAHIDHGKSTLADRMLEVTGTIEKRKMREQVLDDMELEREKGITIKMTPVTMRYRLGATDYKLDLIDTPGHIDFSYEVSRSLKAVEGAILLVDATQGVQAQTLSVFEMARAQGLVLIPVVSKIDSPLARTEEVRAELASLLSVPTSSIVGVSGKTGEGVDELLKTIIERIPPPKVATGKSLQALVFDYSFSEHRGIVMYIRVFGGAVKKGDDLLLKIRGEQFKALEVGQFTPTQKPVEELGPGEIGYVVSGVKEAGKAIIGDTLTSAKNESETLSGYREPQSMVWISLYPESQGDFYELKSALERLKLSDAALSFEGEVSPTLGRGFRCGFLGMLHLEIVIERLRREFNLKLVVTSPSIVYEVENKDHRREKIYSPTQFPDHGTYEKVYEPWVRLTIITPEARLGDVVKLCYTHEGQVGASENWSGGRVSLSVEMPLRELMRGFFDNLKSVSSGFASLSYEPLDMRVAEVARLDIIVAEEPVGAFSQVVSLARAYDEAKDAVERLYDVMPKQLFPVKIQGRARGRILSSKTLPAMRKDVTGYLYGGDITRKMKLLEKQKKGKKKMLARGKGSVEIPQDVFVKMIRREK